MKPRIKYIFPALLLSLFTVMFTSCEDDLNFGLNGYGEGEATVSAEVTFTPLASALNSRAVTGGTPGNAIKKIDQLWVVIFNSKGELCGDDKGNGSGIYKIDKDNITFSDNKDMPDDAPTPGPSEGNHQAESTTVKATFNLPVRLPYGNYKMYAVANVDLSDKPITSEEDLQNIQLTWNKNVLLDNQMFGYFTTTADNKSSGFDAPLVTVASKTVSLRAWLKRAASKVTVAFDARGLKENVWIFLKTVQIKDIPSNCFLGADNPGTPSGTDGDKGQEITDLINNGETITYHDSPVEAYTPESWPEFLTSGHPVYGADPTIANDLSKSVDQRIQELHGENITALYFYENLQGKGKAGTESDKHQQVNDKDKNDQVTSYPDGIKPDDKAWKDAKPYGSYIEVKAYYFSSNPGDMGQGEITYRFMLGKDTHLDYNAERNHHYKLTMRFNGYANDIDWHIDYDREDRPINTPNPYFISYLYNHSMMLPLDIDAGEATSDVTITKITAHIDENHWSPLGASYGATGYTYFNNLNTYYLYFAQPDIVNGRPWNGFLSLRKTEKTVITLDPAPTEQHPLTPDSNKPYYDDSKRGDIEYSGDDLNLSSQTVQQALEEGKLHVALDTDTEDGHKHYIVHMPLWTRAKQLIKTTAYTGNNPFVAYQREAKIKVTVELSNGKVLTSGLSNNGGQISGELISIRQVRRIVNPKGIYRSGSNRNPFHVVLKILPTEESSSFRSLESQGPWRAYVMRDSNPSGTISLKGNENTSVGEITITDRDNNTETYKTIEGKTGSFIDFNVNFEGTTSDDSPNYAVIRVEYNNNTCYHLIFVRQGYGADNLLDGGARWMATNNVAEGQFADNPLDEGSLFKFGQWTGIRSSSNKNNRSPWTQVVPNDFIKNAAGNNLNWTDNVTAGWNHVSRSKNTNSPNVEFGGNQPGYRIAEFKDYKALYDSDDIELGFGVLYGNDSKETLDNIEDVYGYDNSNTDRGMRGCFLYNYKTAKNLFFPIGASGYGHRKNSLSIGGTTYSGVLRYSCAGRPGYFNLTPQTSTSIYAYSGINAAPLFFDLFRRPGAIYWLGKTTTDPIESGNLVGWDFNYFTFDYFPISSGNVDHGADALFIRSIKE